MRSVFIDTNVLIYPRDKDSPTKAARAAMWIRALSERNEAVISPQVVNEFVAVALRRFRTVPLQDIHGSARELIPLCHAPLDGSTTLLAMRIQSDFRTSWWDALIISSALAAGCRYILTEDLQPGMRFGDMVVIDPFATEPQAVIKNN
jgi:predicted nucleic acid-binding protein